MCACLHNTHHPVPTAPSSPIFHCVPCADLMDLQGAAVKSCTCYSELSQIQAKQWWKHLIFMVYTIIGIWDGYGGRVFD